MTSPTALSTPTTAAATSGTSTAGNGQQIAGNFQQFLTLLTTQLKNQSPLDPLDTNQFTQQLVQFASVEQQLKTNTQLDSILTAVKSTSTANAAGYVGMEVTADGSVASLAKGAAEWTINPAKALAKASVTIKNAAGTSVATRSTTLPAGQQTYAWDGKDANGNTLADGTYTLSVTGLDASGQTVAVATDITGAVSAVDVSGESPVLTVAGTRVPLARIKTVATR